MGELYDTDVLAWSENQARLLRQLAAGERLNEPVDWSNIVEEIESVGRSQLSAVRSLLTRALEHDLKCEGWPLTPYVDGWRAEARRFRLDAAEAYAPSMRQRIDVADLYRKALSILPDSIDGQSPLPMPTSCPTTLEELLSDGA